MCEGDKTLGGHAANEPMHVWLIVDFGHKNTFESVKVTFLLEMHNTWKTCHTSQDFWGKNAIYGKTETPFKINLFTWFWLSLSVMSKFKQVVWWDFNSGIQSNYMKYELNSQWDER